MIFIEILAAIIVIPIVLVLGYCLVQLLFLTLLTPFILIAKLKDKK